MKEEIVKEPNIDEFRSLLLNIFPITQIPKMTKKEGLLLFDCVFPEEHNDVKNAHAYAFIKDGMYFAKCQGQVCAPKYVELNKKLKEIQLNSINFKVGKTLGIEDEGVSLFIAPTGWGKTEAIANECLLAINENRKLVVVLQNIEAITRLINRMCDKSGEEQKIRDLVSNDIVYKFTAENKLDYPIKFEKARVILTHHYYFKNAGDILTRFQSTVDLINIPNAEFIIDEAHTFIELATKIDLKIGGLYEKHTYDGLTTYRQNRKSLDLATVKQIGLHRKTAVTEAKLNEYGNVNLNFNNKLYDTVKYIDIFKEIQKRYTLVKSFKENYMMYKYYKNPHVVEPDINSLENTKGALDDLLNPADFAVIGINVGDDLKRRHIGEFSVTLHHYQIINELLNVPKKVILTTATMNDYHKNILNKVTTYNEVDITDKIDKVKTLVLLRNNDANSSRKRTKILTELDNMNVPSLLFMPTIEKAKKYLTILNNSMLNDNGIYSVGERKGIDDYIDNKKRNLTLVGLESSVAKGYNYFEETQGSGFEVVYFDNEPVSPPTIKKYPNENGELEDYKSNYNISTFAQAIGRGFRMNKDVMTLCFNKIDDDAFIDIINYLNECTNSRVIIEDLTLTNLKISIHSMVKNENYEQIKERLKNNALFNTIYEDDTL